MRASIIEGAFFSQVGQNSTAGGWVILSVLVTCSRYAICLKACASETEELVCGSLEESFRRYGLPDAMTMDNGSPWKGYPGQRLSRLVVWLMRHVIKLSHSRPRHPQTQGKDERFHRSFREEVSKYHNFQSLKNAQQCFNDLDGEIFNPRRFPITMDC